MVTFLNIDCARLFIRLGYSDWNDFVGTVKYWTVVILGCHYFAPPPLALLLMYRLYTKVCVEFVLHEEKSVSPPRTRH